MDVGQEIGISVGSATAHCMVAVAFVHGRISAASEKAIKVTLYREGDFADGASVWFPKKALRPSKDEDGKVIYYTLARWFRPDGYASRMIERHAHTGCVSA